MTAILAMDSGGSNTRAAVFDLRGKLLGFGAAGAGNVTSAGESALEAVLSAAVNAIREADVDAANFTAVLCAAGEAPASLSEQLSQRLGGAADVDVQVVPDSLGAYFSGTTAQDGIVLVVGTGAIASRVAAGALARIVDGLGWLIGDEGGGYWIGRRVAMAAAADLDGRGAETALTAAVLEVLEARTGRWSDSRRPEVSALLSAVYAKPPVALAELAPIAFRLEDDDPIAAGILAEAEVAIARTLEVVRCDEDDLPIVTAGSVLTRGFLSPSRSRRGALTRMLLRSNLHAATDGLVGAAALALGRHGVSVTERMRATMDSQLAQRRA